MSGPINIRELAAGTRILLATGAEAEIVTNPRDGVWLFVRSADSDGEEEMVFAQDVVEVRA